MYILRYIQYKIKSILQLFFVLLLFQNQTTTASPQTKELVCNPEWGWCDFLLAVNDLGGEARLILSINEDKALINYMSFFWGHGINYYLWYDKDRFSLWEKARKQGKRTLTRLFEIPYVIPTEFSTYIIYLIGQKDSSSFYVYANPRIPLKVFQKLFSKHMKYIGHKSYLYGVMYIEYYKSPIETMMADFVPSM